MVATTVLDPRVNAFRPDLADASLQPLVKVARYAEPSIRQCVKGILPLFKEPHAASQRVSEIRYGEFLDVFEERADGFAWVQNRNDHYVGYIPYVEALSENIASFSNKIHVLRSFVYAEPDPKARLLDVLTLGSYVCIVGQRGDYLELASGGFVFAGHVKETESAETRDYVGTAGRMVGVPYLWGGRTPVGIDGSGLVQLVLEMAGIESPRDADQQQKAFGQELDIHWRDVAWKRGDMVFLEGHAGLMTGADHLIHADSHRMQVVVEPLADVVARKGVVLAKGRP